MTCLRASLVLLALPACLSAPPEGVVDDDKDGGGVASSNHSVRLQGSRFEQNGVDRVWIPAQGGTPAGKLGSSAFTVEMWLELDADAIGDAPCNGDEWWRNHLLLDREFLMDPPQDGNIGFGVWRSGTGSGVAFGFQVLDDEVNLCGDQPIADGGWHHVAVVRYPTDLVVLYVDGVPDDSANGPTGDGRITPDAEGEIADLSMVLGGDKHGTLEAPRNFAGWIDDLRFSKDPIYVDAFDPPDAPLAVEDSTTALYSFDEGAGVSSVNRAEPGASDAELRTAPGGVPAGPSWSDDTPF